MQHLTRWSFAGFDIDLASAVLRKNGEPLRINPQAFRALALLVSRNGELVTREELQKEIWGARVHVDFEHGLNVCIRQVRTALGDDAEGNQIVVTCPRVGYRLGVPAKPVTPTRWPFLTRSFLGRWGAAAAGVAAVIGAGYLFAPSVLGRDATASNVAPSGASRSTEAHSWYLRGRSFYDRSTAKKGALIYFERATTLDPTFAPAQAGLAVAYLERAGSGVATAESIVKAKQAARHALALDPRSAETHVALAELSYRLDDDERNAEQEYLRAVALDARNTYVRQRYATFLAEQRRFDDALEQLRVAQELDPLSVISRWQQADTLFYAHRWEESLMQAHRTLELDPTHAPSFRTIGQCLDAMGRHDEAIAAYLKAGHKALGHLGREYAVVGRRAEARELLATLERQPIDSDGHNGVAIAYIYTGLGEPAKAMEWLEKAHHDGVRLPFSIRVAPQWEPLRTSREFNEFLKTNQVAGI